MVSTRSGSPPAFRSPAWPLGLLALALLSLIGCQRDEIRHYQAEQANVAPRPRGAAPETKLRLLAVLAPRGEKMWVFKFLGPLDDVTEQEEKFGAFVRSLRFADKGPTWKLPAGWEEEGPAGARHATLHAGPKGSSPQLTVFELPKSPVLVNINRWRTGDLGLTEKEEGDLGSVSNKRTVNDTELTVIDMTGPGPGKGPASRAGAKLPFAFKVPSGWKARGPRTGVLAAFLVRDGKKTAEVTISALSREFGGMRANIDRWRGQVGAPPISDDEFTQMKFPRIEVGGAMSQSVDLSGPRGRMVLVVTPHEDKTWFFKLLGDEAVVAAQKENFEAFLKSIKFRAGRGAADE